MIGGNSDLYLIAGAAVVIHINTKQSYLRTYRRFAAHQNVANIVGEAPKAVLLWCDEDATELVAGLRGRGDKLADVPVVLVGDRDLAGIDQRIDAPVTPDDIARLFETWRTVENDSLDRLVATFGLPDIRSLIVRLRLLLVESLDRLDGGDAGAIAHRVAGACGTLGYREASAAWLDEAAEPDALRIVTRRTIYRIACDLERLT